MVAKRMMQRPGGGSALVGRIVTSAQAAVTAAADGASLLLVSVSFDGDYLKGAGTLIEGSLKGTVQLHEGSGAAYGGSPVEERWRERWCFWRGP